MDYDKKPIFTLVSSEQYAPSPALQFGVGVTVPVLFALALHAAYDRPTPPYPPESHIEQITHNASLSSTFVGSIRISLPPSS